MYTYTRSRRVCTRQAAHMSAPVGTRAGAALAPPKASNCAQARPASPGRCFFCAPWVDVPVQSSPALVPLLPPPPALPLPPPLTEVDVPVQSPPQWTCWADEASGSQRFLALVARLKLTKCRLLLARRATRIADALATPARREMFGSDFCGISALPGAPGVGGVDSVSAERF